MGLFAGRRGNARQRSGNPGRHNRVVECGLTLQTKWDTQCHLSDDFSLARVIFSLPGFPECSGPHGCHGRHGAHSVFKRAYSNNCRYLLLPGAIGCYGSMPSLRWPGSEYSIVAVNQFDPVSIKHADYRRFGPFLKPKAPRHEQR